MDQIYIIIALFLLLCFVLFKELTRVNKSNLSFRILASILAIIALYFIISPISISHKVTAENRNSAILLTEAFQEDSLKKWQGMPLFSRDIEISKKNKNVQYIADLNTFIEKNPHIQNFHVFGFGLEQSDIELLKGKKILFHPSPVPDGISKINWQRKIKSGEELIVQGQYINSQNKEIKLILKGLGTNLDSVIIGKNESQFELKCIPKNLDEAVYNIIVLSNNDTLSKEDIPFQVKEKEAINILILASSPDFENKFLKNWLSEEGNHVALRTRISTNKFNTEFLNGPKIDLTRINSTMLEKFDLVICDQQEISNLSDSETKALQNHLNNGLGLFIKSDEIITKKAFYSNAFNVLESKMASSKNLNLIWENKKVKKEIINSKTSLHIQATPGNQNLIKNDSGEVLISSKLVGEGKLILSLIQDSYTWLLRDQKSEYATFWTYILNKAINKKEKSNSSIITKIAYLNKKIELKTDSSEIQINKDKIALYQDPILQFEWIGTWWPKNIGWQSINNEKDKLYVFDKSAWSIVRASEKIENMKHQLQLFKDVQKKEEIEDSFYEEQISTIWFYFLFLICCTYLWLEEKLS